MSIVDLEDNSPSIAFHELTLGGVVAGVTIWSLLAVALAQLGLFRAGVLSVAGLISAAAGLVFWHLQRPTTNCATRHEILFTILLLLAGLLLYAWPAEHYPLLGDSAIYPGTAARLIRDQGLTYHFEPFDGLSLTQKQLFFVPADRQLPYIQIKSYNGLLFGAYYIMDIDHNLAVSSRPPLVIVWMGLFGKLFDIAGMLYLTPLFGALSLIMFYFVGRRLFGPVAGALAAIWLLVSFLQLHFSRTPYAEIVGQFFVLSTLYGLITYLQTRQPYFLILGIAALTAGFATRIDTILIMPTIVFFFLILLVKKDSRGVVLGSTSLTIALAFTLWTVNRPYVGATAELLLAAQLRALKEPILITALAGIGLLMVSLLLLLVRRWPKWGPPNSVRIVLILLLVAAVGYGLYIRPLIPEQVLFSGQWVPTHNEELMAVTAQYISQVVIWLAVAGAALLLWRWRVFSPSGVFLLFVLSFSLAFFWKYTTARVYPVALRRLVPEVFPGLLLLGGYAVSRLAHWRRWRPAAMVIAGLVISLQLWVASPYWFYREAPGTGGFLQELSRRLPAGAVTLFEPQQNDSIVGWFAAPLWSFYDRRALLLRGDHLDAQALNGALCQWRQQNRAIYLVAQRDPQQWWPGEFPGSVVDQVRWDSSIIGQSLYFPPFIWHFDFVFTIYRLTLEKCPT